MKAKIGSPEWIDRVTRNALDNRANQLNPNNIRYSAKPGSECASQSITALGYGILAAGIATGIAIAGIAAYAHRHMGKKDKSEDPKEVIEIPLVTIEENEAEPVTAEEAAGCA